MIRTQTGITSESQSHPWAHERRLASVKFVLSHWPDRYLRPDRYLSLKVLWSSKSKWGRSSGTWIPPWRPTPPCLQHPHPFPLTDRSFGSIGGSLTYRVILVCACRVEARNQISYTPDDHLQIVWFCSAIAIAMMVFREESISAVPSWCMHAGCWATCVPRFATKDCAYIAEVFRWSDLCLVRQDAFTPFGGTPRPPEGKKLEGRRV